MKDWHRTAGFSLSHTVLVTSLLAGAKYPTARILRKVSLHWLMFQSLVSWLHGGGAWWRRPAFLMASRKQRKEDLGRETNPSGRCPQ